MAKTILYPDYEDNHTNPVSSTVCDTANICVPVVNVPDKTLQIGSNITTNVSSASIIKTAEDISKLPEATAVTVPSDVHKNILNTVETDINSKMANEPDYKDLSAYLAAEFPKTEDTPFSSSSQQEIDELMKRIQEMLDKDIEEVPSVDEIDNDKLTERVVDGSGVFDNLASAIYNQLNYARKNQLLTNADLGTIYTTSLVQALQTAADFTLKKDEAYWSNMLVKAQVQQAQMQTLLTKAELLMLPVKTKLAYAQLETAYMQAYIERAKLPQITAQTDQILAQTDGVRLSNTLQQIQIKDSKLKLDITKETIKQAVAQTNQLISQAQLADAQKQKTLKEVKLVDANILELKARIQIMAQQLEKEKEQIALAKGQTAEAYTRINLLAEQIKAAKAQYSDTIDGKPVRGIIGTQNALHRKQSLSYDRDSLFKILQLQSQGWQVKKNADIGIKSPSAFTAAGVDGGIQAYLATYFNDKDQLIKDWGSSTANKTADGTGASEVYGRINQDWLKPIDGYNDYLTDAQLDGTVSTNTGNSK